MSDGFRPDGPRILITGANSLIGAGIARYLIDSGQTVVAFDREDTRLPRGCDFVSGDVRNFEALAAVAAGCDAGIHLAALAGENSAADIVAVNVIGAIGFLRAARSGGFNCAVLASSAPVHLQATAADSDLLLRTADDMDHIYDLSKALQEVAARDFHGHGLPCLCLRFGHVVDGRRSITLDEGTSLADEDYCRGGWVAIEDVVSACVASLAVVPRSDEFETLNLVGSRAGRKRFNVALAEQRLGVRMVFDFAEFETPPD